LYIRLSMGDLNLVQIIDVKKGSELPPQINHRP